MHFKCVLAISCSNSFSHCKEDQKKTVAISQKFNHVQLHVLWMHLLNTRICRYTCIYIQHLQYKHIAALQVHDVEMTFHSRLCDVITSYRRHFDVMCLLGVTKTVCKKMCSVRYISYKIWTQINPFFICSV